MITHRLTTLLINAVVSPEEGMTTTPHRTMLSTVQQRHPSILQSASDQVMFENESAKEAVEQLIISLSMVNFHIHSRFYAIC